jgi:hypothetical protein
MKYGKQHNFPANIRICLSFYFRLSEMFAALLPQCLLKWLRYAVPSSTQRQATSLGFKCVYG